jgi:hypothetical protein
VVSWWKVEVMPVAFTYVRNSPIGHHHQSLGLSLTLYFTTTQLFTELSHSLKEWSSMGCWMEGSRNIKELKESKSIT